MAPENERVIMRAVGPEDAAALLPAFNGDADFNILSSGVAEVPLAVAQADLIETAGMPGGQSWRIEDPAGELVGVAETALVPPPHTGWIALLIIRRDRQGAGLGAAAAAWLEQRFFADPAVERVGLGVIAANERALAFWERRGYGRGLKRRDQLGHEIITLRLERPDATARDPAAQLARSRRQFGPAAAAYGASAGHAQGDELRRVAELAAEAPLTGVALDVATGGGHTAFALAPYLRAVVAADVTPEMLDETARGAASRGLANITTQIADAHALPFADASFDLVTCRIAPHHFSALPLALREMARVTTPGGRVLIVDSVVPDAPDLALFLNHIERLRDPSHVRSLTEPEWRELFVDSGLVIEEAARYRRTHAYAPWVERMSVPPEARARIDAAFLDADERTRAAFGITVDNGQVVSYQDEKLLIVGRKPA